MSDRPVIVAALRSPMGKGKEGGALSGLHAVDLLSQVIDQLVTSTGIDPGSVDDVLIGCVSQAGEQSGTPGRQAWLAAGFPEHVPSTTIERKCGSGQQAIDFAAQGIAAGAYRIAIAGGIESMSRVPMGSNRMGMDPQGPLVRERFPDLTSQGVAAELVADKWGLTREQLDEYAAESHRGPEPRRIPAASTPRSQPSPHPTARCPPMSRSVAERASRSSPPSSRPSRPRTTWPTGPQSNGRSPLGTPRKSPMVQQHCC